MMAGNKCDTCGGDGVVGVYSLPFAAMSVAACRTCINEDAFPHWAVIAAIQINGGKAETAQWLLDCKTYIRGRYVYIRDLPEPPPMKWPEEPNVQN